MHGWEGIHPLQPHHSCETEKDRGGIDKGVSQTNDRDDNQTNAVSSKRTHTHTDDNQTNAVSSKRTHTHRDDNQTNAVSSKRTHTHRHDNHTNDISPTR